MLSDDLIGQLAAELDRDQRYPWETIAQLVERYLADGPADKARFVWSWTESGGPPVTAPTKMSERPGWH